MHKKLFTALTAVCLAATMTACGGTTTVDDERDGRETTLDPERGTAGTSGAGTDESVTGTSGEGHGAMVGAQTGTAGQSGTTRQGGTAGSTPGGAPEADERPRGQDDGKSGQDTTGTTGRTGEGAQDFVRFAMTANMAEIELGKLAQQRASNMQVKNFAQQMVEDHTKASAELKQAAGSTQSQGQDGQLDPKHRQLRDRLSKLSGAEFDREYMSAMVEDHRMAVQRFKQQASSGSGELQNFAKMQLPALQNHLEMAQKIQSQVR